MRQFALVVVTAAVTAALLSASTAQQPAAPSAPQATVYEYEVFTFDQMFGKRSPDEWPGVLKGLLNAGAMNEGWEYVGQADGVDEHPVLILRRPKK